MHLILGRQLELRAQVRANMSSGEDKFDPTQGQAPPRVHCLSGFLARLRGL